MDLGHVDGMNNSFAFDMETTLPLTNGKACSGGK